MTSSCTQLPKASKYQTLQVRNQYIMLGIDTTETTSSVPLKAQSAFLPTDWTRSDKSLANDSTVSFVVAAWVLALPIIESVPPGTSGYLEYLCNPFIHSPAVTPEISQGLARVNPTTMFGSENQRDSGNCYLSDIRQAFETPSYKPLESVSTKDDRSPDEYTLLSAHYAYFCGKIILLPEIILSTMTRDTTYQSTTSSSETHQEQSVVSPFPYDEQLTIPTVQDVEIWSPTPYSVASHRPAYEHTPPVNEITNVNMWSEWAMQAVNPIQVWQMLRAARRLERHCGTVPAFLVVDSEEPEGCPRDGVFIPTHQSALYDSGPTENQQRSVVALSIGKTYPAIPMRIAHCKEPPYPRVSNRNIASGSLFRQRKSCYPNPQDDRVPGGTNSLTLNYATKDIPYLQATNTRYIASTYRSLSTPNTPSLNAAYQTRTHLQDLHLGNSVRYQSITNLRTMDHLSHTPSAPQTRKLLHRNYYNATRWDLNSQPPPYTMDNRDDSGSCTLSSRRDSITLAASTTHHLCRLDSSSSIMPGDYRIFNTIQSYPNLPRSSLTSTEQALFANFDSISTKQIGDTTAGSYEQFELVDLNPTTHSGSQGLNQFQPSRIDNTTKADEGSNLGAVSFGGFRRVLGLCFGARK